MTKIVSFIGTICVGLMLMVSTVSVSVSAHSFDSEALQYILSPAGTEATREEFSNYMLAIDTDGVFATSIETLESRIAIALSLPQKKLVAVYAVENPDFTLADIQQQIGDDPMLNEFGAEAVFSFLTTALSETTELQTAEVKKTSIIEFIRLGFDHILGGYDHILFIFALLITLPGRKPLLGLLSTFTIAHTTTIILGGVGLVTLSPAVVEPIIMGSIAIAALLARNKPAREARSQEGRFAGGFVGGWNIIAIVFGLGLIHGLGFSSFYSTYASEIGLLPVLGFNLGVELGQLVIVGVAYPLLRGVYRLFNTHRTVVKQIIIVILCGISVGLLF